MKAVLRFEFGPLVGFALLSFLLMVALEGVLISRLFRRKGKPLEMADSSSSGTHITKELAAQSRTLSEPVSVIDHTTRTLDPIYSERK